MKLRSPGVLGMALIAVLGVYCLTLATGTVTNDAMSTSLASWRIAETGTPYLEGSGWEEFDKERHDGSTWLWVGEAPNGHEVAFRSPGAIAAGVPGYLVSSLLGAEFSILPGSAMAALLTAASLGLLALAIQPRMGTGASVMTILAVGLTTPFWSVSADSLWTHPVTLLGIGGMAWASARERWLLVGLFGGIAVWGRLHTALIVAILGLGIALARRQPRVALLVGSVSGTFLALSFAWGRWMYGTWSPAGGYSVTSYAERATSSDDALAQLINHAGLWLAPDRGIFVWTPLLVILIPALIRAWRVLPDWTRLLVIGGFAYAVVQGQLNGFSGGSSFYGYRLTLEVLACWVPAFVMAVPHAGRAARALIGPLLGLQFAVISVGAANDGGVLAESELWTKNSFVEGVIAFPPLILWVIAMMGVGMILARVVRRVVEPRSVDPAHTVPIPGDVTSRLPVHMA